MSVADRGGTDIAAVLGVGENVSEEPYSRTMSWMLEIGAIVTRRRCLLDPMGFPLCQSILGVRRR